MLELLKRLIAGRELAALNRYRYACHLVYRWMGNHLASAESAEWIRQVGEDQRGADISNFRGRIENELAMLTPMGSVGMDGLHPRTAYLVQRFAIALAKKLAAAERKYGYSDGWAKPGWMDECRKKLVEHVAKGDPRDVAAYCAFLWHHGERTASFSPAIEEKSPAMFGRMIEGDFEKQTITFQMAPPYYMAAGRYAIYPVPDQDKAG